MKHRAVKVQMNNLSFTVLYNQEFYNTDPSDAVYFHTHYMFEFHYLLKGYGTLYTEAGERAVKAGMGILLGRDAVHLFKSAPDALISRFAIIFDYESNDEVLTDPFLCFLNHTSVFFTDNIQSIEPFLSALHKELQRGDFLCIQAIKAYLSLILIELSRVVTEGQVFPDFEEEPFSEMNIKTFTVIDDFFYQNYQLNPASIDLEKILNVSNRQLHRIMLRYFGLTFQQKLIQVRLSVAKNLLVNTLLPVSQIAEQCGYEYASSFCKSFRLKNGQTPEEYRKSYQHLVIK